MTQNQQSQGHLRHWRLWLPLPKRYAPESDELLNELKTTNIEFKVAKYLHLFVSGIPFFWIIFHQKANHPEGGSPIIVVLAFCLSVLVYFVLAYLISRLWDYNNYL